MEIEGLKDHIKEVPYNATSIVFIFVMIYYGLYLFYL
jgi:hypothetical protein